MPAALLSALLAGLPDVDPVAAGRVSRLCAINIVWKCPLHNLGCPTLATTVVYWEDLARRVVTPGAAPPIPVHFFFGVGTVKSDPTDTQKCGVPRFKVLQPGDKDWGREGSSCCQTLPDPRPPDAPRNPHEDRQALFVAQRVAGTAGPQCLRLLGRVSVSQSRVCSHLGPLGRIPQFFRSPCFCRPASAATQWLGHFKRMGIAPASQALAELDPCTEWREWHQEPGRQAAGRLLRGGCCSLSTRQRSSRSRSSRSRSAPCPGEARPRRRCRGLPCRHLGC
jgi:hypothetical protein